ncbi:hypothetical protein [Sporocytophaga myxococcoides]|uniref:hypothetical protein n=1 Tax=Sporocytophaga myxococcoides TaxID=153721 RepID=UPI00068887C5|nr:hypothetical protein [Sporocytophaga myxococcoides]
MHKFSVRLIVLVVLPFLFSFRNSEVITGEKLTAADTSALFVCTVDDKPMVIKNFNAYMRTVTGGYRQLSLSNDRFSKFFLIKPEVTEIKLGSNALKQVVIHYTDPANLNLYKPHSGVLRIKVLDENKKVLSGEFEMELTCKNNPSKKIKIKNGKLINIPIVYLQ